MTTREMSVKEFQEEGYFAEGEAVQKVVPATGTANIPVILINFSDTTTTYSKTDFNTLLFVTGNNSMKDYYNEVSYGKFSVSAGSSGVVGWYTASKTHDYYGQNNTQGNDTWAADLVYEAVKAADAAVDFSAYDMDGDGYVDAVNIVHQGKDAASSGNSTDIWSHRWSLSSAKYYGQSHYDEYTTNDKNSTGNYVKINDYTIEAEQTYDGTQETVGVFAHEYGHALGLPDLYDTDYSSYGIGDWSLMAGGSYNYVTKSGDRPAHLDAWCKYYLGWATPTQVSGTLTNESITQGATTSDVYKLLNGSPSSGEYFLVENRQKTGFDAGLPGSGLLIWHIDGNTITSKSLANEVNDSECYSPSDCSANHYGVALIQADGQWNLEKKVNQGDVGDPYPGSANNKSFTDSSSPNSKLYNGNKSNVCITNISASGTTMTATLSSVCSGTQTSCPSLYYWNGRDYVRKGFIIGGAVGSEKEYLDRVPLNQLVLKDGRYYLQIRETEPENSFIDTAKLIIIDHGSDVKLDNSFRKRNLIANSNDCRTHKVLDRIKIALDRLKQSSNVKIHELTLVSAEHQVNGDVLSQVSYSDNEYVNMSPGDIVTLTFSSIPLEDEKRDFVFCAEGYYISLDESETP
ncbi:MAG TPA: M6 family metalloprotease domain-containing protein [Candidatus Wunengus sp. YC65]|uniref:M6 family metalloprotease domain-containing protein n=1 Tax=Candidatus Wunengus sp. YC65 TaxID=3367701 RepID=UPI004026E9D2